jgi:hypothetical protein
MLRPVRSDMPRPPYTFGEHTCPQLMYLAPGVVSLFAQRKPLAALSILLMNHAGGCTAIIWKIGMA